MSERDNTVSTNYTGVGKPTLGDSVAVLYMAQTPLEGIRRWIPAQVEVEKKPVDPMFPLRNENKEDLVELLEAVDVFVKGEPLTEKIMSLRTKTAIIRDRLERRTRRIG